MQISPEAVAKIEADRQEYVRGRLRRWRKNAGLTLEDVAEKLEVSQQAVSKQETKGTASEENLTKLWGLYGIRDSYPSAPKDPDSRREWVDARNASIQTLREKP